MQEAPPIPTVFARHLDIWSVMHAHRTAHLGGPARFTLSDLASYTVITGDRLDRADLDTLSWIEEEWFASRAEAEERREKAKPPDGKPDPHRHRR